MLTNNLGHIVFVVFIITRILTRGTVDDILITHDMCINTTLTLLIITVILISFVLLGIRIIVKKIIKLRVL